MPSSETETGNIKQIPKTKDSIAVAIQQTDGTSSTPKVIAGGKGAVARQILEIAFQNGIKVREDSNLAELLSVVDVESEIPLEAFAAVAEILTYVYQLNNTMDPETEKTQDLSDNQRMNANDLAAMWSTAAESDE